MTFNIFFLFLWSNFSHLYFFPLLFYILLAQIVIFPCLSSRHSGCKGYSWWEIFFFLTHLLMGDFLLIRTNVEMILSHETYCCPWQFYCSWWAELSLAASCPEYRAGDNTRKKKGVQLLYFWLPKELTGWTFFCSSSARGKGLTP